MSYIDCFNPDTGVIKMSSNPSDVFDFYKGAGFSFSKDSKEIISRYVLSLKTKPFVILSGISGTGKTKIAQLFADYMLQEQPPDNESQEQPPDNESDTEKKKREEEKEKRKAFISVRPDWTDNRGLLGYYNLLDLRYYTTKLLRLLLEAKEHPEKPYFIILDEMNLARVEHYFSDFLSIMESRTPDNPKGECIELHPIREGKVLAAGSEEVIPHEIHIPNNVYFTGTVNVDESTYMFSPKVLDRANVIEFNEVNFSGQKDESTLKLKGETEITVAGTAEKVLNVEVCKWFHDPEASFCSKSDFDAADLKLIREKVQELKDLLYPYHLHFGYRVAYEMARFVNLSSKYADGNNLTDALDIQILQKVLPKFHGTQGKLEEPLGKLKNFCNENGFHRSAKKLERMLEELKNQGYCSFITG